MNTWELRDGFGMDRLRRGSGRIRSRGLAKWVLAMRAASLNLRDTLVVRGGYGPRSHCR